MPSSPSCQLDRRRLTAVVSAALLSGCATLPHIGGLTGRDIGLARSEPPRAAGENRALSPDDDVAALQQQYDIQRGLSESPLVFGNKVTLLPSGRKAFEAFFAALVQARDNINLEYFILADVVSGGTRLSAILLGKLQAGVKVVEFNPLDPLTGRTAWSPNDRDHRKIMVVDGRVGFTGGINLDHAYENPPAAGVPPDGDARRSFWRDVAVRIEGPAVAEPQKLFFGTWQEQRAPAADPADYFPPLPCQGVQTIRVIGSSPGERQPPLRRPRLTGSHRRDQTPL